jgi:hypothetical protein
MSETIHLGIARLATANTSAVKNRAPDIILNLSIIFGQNKSCRTHKNEEMIEREKYNNIDWFFTNFRETRNKNICIKHVLWSRLHKCH